MEDESIGSLIQQNALSLNSSHDAIIYLHLPNDNTIEKWSYKKVWEEAENISNVFKRLVNSQKGDSFKDHNTIKVGIMVEDGPYLPILELATLLSRYIIIPIDRNDPRVEFILEDAQPHLIITPNDQSLSHICDKFPSFSKHLHNYHSNNKINNESKQNSVKNIPQIQQNNSQNKTQQKKTQKNDQRKITNKNNLKKKNENNINNINNNNINTISQVEEIIVDKNLIFILSLNDLLKLSNENKHNNNKNNNNFNHNNYEKNEYNKKEILEDISHIIFTSGSTGRPKGCLLKHKCLLNYCQAKNELFQITENSINFVASPLTFDPSLGDFFSTWIGGGCVSIAKRSSIFSHLPDCLIASSATHLLTTPSLFGTIQSFETSLFPSMKVVALGGELMSGDILHKWEKQVKLINIYGVTECCVYQAYSLLQSTFTLTSIPSSQRVKLLTHSMKGNFLFLVDKNDKMKEVKEGSGEVGEISISGLQIAEGYLLRDQLTAEKFFNHPKFGFSFLTGDLALTLPLPPSFFYLPYNNNNNNNNNNNDNIKENDKKEEGEKGDTGKKGEIGDKIEIGVEFYWQMMGRKDCQVKINGQRIELEEIDSVIQKLFLSFPLFQTSSVVKHKNGKLISFCVPIDPSLLDHFDNNNNNNNDQIEKLKEKKRELTRKFLRFECEKRLPLIMTPSSFLFIEKLPVTRSGKIARSQLVNHPLPIQSIDLHPDFDNYDEYDDQNEKKEYLNDDQNVNNNQKNNEENEKLKNMIKILKSIWEEEFQIKITNNKVNFIELGGDSLAALRVCRQISSALSHNGINELKEGGGGGGGQATGESGGGGGEFGEFFDILSPAKLLKKSVLFDYANYLSKSFSNLSNDSLNHNINLNNNNNNNLKEKIVNKSDEEEIMDKNYSYFYQAIGVGSIEIIDYLLTKYQLDVNGRANNQIKKGNITPLHIAANNNQPKVIEYLINKGGSISAVDSHGTLPLHLAVQKITSLEVIKMMINLKSSLITAKDNNQQTILHHAARSGSSSSLFSLLISYWKNEVNGTKSKNSNINMNNKMFDVVDKWERTPMHWAVINGHRLIVMLLMDEGASIKMKDSAGETPLEMAERRARCGASVRPDGLRTSVFGDIATLLGGNASTKQVSNYA